MIVAFGTIAFLAGALGERLKRSQRAHRLLNRASAVVLAGLAVRLLTASR